MLHSACGSRVSTVTPSSLKRLIGDVALDILRLPRRRLATVRRLENGRNMTERGDSCHSGY